jgi:arginase family enzyme
MPPGLVLNLDDSLASQEACADLPVLALRHWGPKIRIACGFGRFRAFEREMAAAMTGLGGDVTWPVFCGSGDFHHVSLAFCRALRGPINLLVLDKHPDWVRPLPLLHCGSWLWHAARLPAVHRVFHVGGDSDFDNGYRHLAPWSLLRQDKIVVFPAARTYVTGRWPGVRHLPVRLSPHVPALPPRWRELLAPWREELAARPLYISLDKDVMQVAQAVGNWDSGLLTLQETLDAIDAFLQASGGACSGMDVFGDWSPCRTRGMLRRALAWAEHPRLSVEPARAAQINSATNRIIRDHMEAFH